jgi:hypothetical protein
MARYRVYISERAIFSFDDLVGAARIAFRVGAQAFDGDQL